MTVGAWGTLMEASGLAVASVSAAGDATAAVAVIPNAAEAAATVSADDGRTLGAAWRPRRRSDMSLLKYFCSD